MNQHRNLSRNLQNEPIAAREGLIDRMPKQCKQRTLKCLRTNLLTILTLFGVLAGIVLGIILRASRDDKWTQREIMYVTFVGDIFLQMLKCLILPLITASIITAIGGIDLSLSGRIGGRAVGYYMATTVSAVILGMVLCVVIQPGSGVIAETEDDEEDKSSGRNFTTVDTLMDLVRNMFPPNLIQACIQQYQTVLLPPSKSQLEKATKNLTLYDWKISHKFENGMNIMGLVVFSVVFGITISKMGKNGEPLLKFFTALGAAMMIITNWVIWISPLGVAFLIAGKMLEMETFGVLVGQLGMYFMTVLLGLFIHGFIVTPFYFTIATRTLPFRFIANMAEALVTAFGTASSNATLPLSMKCLEEKNNIDPRVSRFVMPIGATINMDGTALYEAVAAIFISQVRGRVLTLGQLIAISITSTAASIGAAGIPQAGLVTMVMVLDTVGLPSEDVTLIIAVDWLLDRFRTTINVLGDSLGAGIVNHFSKSELNLLPNVPLADAERQETQTGKLSSEEEDN
ncbi:excitatory amino acid transporter 1 isoform X2 [Anabrus simplex]|uniref:excitatory amino acid transporter 1 isoform X2 n=1 Tax=Anabrus simplex TaxID=316456 RepID=UPI0035A30798